MLAALGRSRRDANKIKREEATRSFWEILRIRRKPKVAAVGSSMQAQTRRPGAPPDLDASGGVARRSAQQAPPQSIHLLLAVGYLEGISPAARTRHWNRLLHQHGRLPRRPRISKDA